MDRVREAGRKILDRAVVIAGRMKQRGDKPAVASAPAQAVGESPEEKLRRVQRELNQVNSRPVTGRTRQEIDQQEKDRKELANLVLANNRIEKGELTSLTVQIPKDEPEKPPAVRRRPAAAPQ